ncbi:whole genome shotgun sequence [Seminavis robusta]|uniref:Whole genome shotgun sequence n=1 Tax=Seminavis robusta TaxID=568900 RepID=A0A9N8EFD2_9STRA|nr:whole genome shotgun sequence [Seminavis robusta]|eukprot:Sro1042_g234650.1 whole genome shotgun sequence (674) ;mRNA; r:2827-4848
MDDATVVTTKSAASAKGLPKCVCSWKNCRTYQKAYKSYGHSILDGIVKVKFIKGDTASIPLKASVDRTLKVPKEKRQDWKPAKGEEIIRYNIARHHFTEPHIQRYCQDPKRYKWTSLFSEAEAKKYLFKQDPKETMSLGDAEVYYVQCPNVSKDYVKQQFLKMKAEMEEKEAQEHALRQQQQQSSALGRFLGSGGGGTTSGSVEEEPRHQLPEHKDSMTISTTRSSELLARKEEENNRLRKELEACKSQLTYLHEMVRQLQEDTCDNMSVYSRKSTRSRANKKNKAGGGAYGMGSGPFPLEVELVDDEASEWDGGGDGEDEIEDWSDADDEDETIMDDQSSDFMGKASPGALGVHGHGGGPKSSKMGRRTSLASRASIVSASQSVKSLPREIELAEDEENGSGSEDSSMADAFDDRSYVSRGSRVSRASHSIDNNDYSGGGKDRRSKKSRGGGGKSRGKSKGSSNGYGGGSNGSDVETYEVKQQVIVDPYGEKGTYAGSLSKATGMPHGKGRLEYAAGRWYEGDWKHGRWTGRGRLSNGDGDLYEGELRNDHKHGKGTMRFADGRVFVGEYINGQMIEGRMTYQDGSTYDGSWVDGMRHGRGKCVFTDDSIYEGEFREGEFHGHGKMSWADGGWYEGEWWNGEMQGHGREVRPDGSLRHEGAWSKGQPLRNRK